MSESTSVAPVSGRVVSVPGTGEQLDLDASDDQLATWLKEMQEFRKSMAVIERALKDELLSRMDRRGRWTHHAAGASVSAESPQPGEDFDGEGLYRELMDIVRDGELDREAVDAAIELLPVSYKVKKSGITALRRIGGRAAAAVEAHRIELEAKLRSERRVTVK